MARISRKRFSLRIYLIAIILTALAAVAVTVGIILSSGARYTTYSTSEHGKIKFVGKVDRDGVPIKGTVYFADGMTAEVSKGKAAGKSEGEEGLDVYSIKLTYSNGDIYEGETVYFLRHGSGTLTFAGGDRYEGEFVFDDMEGTGSYYYMGGDIYTGEFADNQKDGQGTFQWAAAEDGSFDSYTGQYRNDARNGEGVYTYADGTVFQGNYVDDAKNGQGSLQFPNGDSYTGEFLNDYRTGKGTYTWASGDSYTGDFYRNSITGYGTYSWVEGANRKDYTGYFESGKIVLVEEEEPTGDPTGENTES